MFKHQTIAFQRLEGGALLFFAIYNYLHLGGRWWVFALLLLVVDLSIVGYLVNNRVGALLYNIGHSLILPLIFICCGVLLNKIDVQFASLIWIGHIGVDRLFGYGLKESTGFTHTHLGEIGRK